VRSVQAGAPAVLGQAVADVQAGQEQTATS